MKTDDNGIPHILYWIMGALLTVSTGTVAITASWFNARLVAVEIISSSASERSKVNEARINLLEDGLSRIENKLDEALKERRMDKP